MVVELERLIVRVDYKIGIFLCRVVSQQGRLIELHTLLTAARASEVG